MEAKAVAEGKNRIASEKETFSASSKDSKEADDDADVAASAVEAEWKESASERKSSEAMHTPCGSAAIKRGFRINSMTMRDALSGELHWASDAEFSQGDAEAHLSRSILACKAVSREINFTCAEEIANFRLEQRVLFHGTCIEEWCFSFGFVIPGSTNSWQQVIEAAEAMIAAEELSGNIVIETNFYDGESFISRSTVRIFYD
jgi:retinal rod rhodopsin-sensitive cGMP 3',5'-cyclic phosphodiesterase subunit delta